VKVHGVLAATGMLCVMAGCAMHMSQGVLAVVPCTCLVKELAVVHVSCSGYVQCVGAVVHVVLQLVSWYTVASVVFVRRTVSAWECWQKVIRGSMA
jgi:hypothetical protein